MVYTGNETKFGQNKDVPEMKLTKSDKMINWFTVILFCFQVVVVLLFHVVNSRNPPRNRRNSQFSFDSEVVRRFSHENESFFRLFGDSTAIFTVEQLDDSHLAQSHAGGLQSDIFYVHQL